MRIVDGRFIDEGGRTLILRGCNLGGDSKFPTNPDGRTGNGAGFYDHREVSFVGRPFPEEEADEHFARLARWGFTFLRFLVSWEAVEHGGPGQYDEAYLAYLRKILKAAERHGISVFMDPHQDVWSRWTGGDGAPGWTMEALGMDLRVMHRTGSAILHQEYGDPFPRMIWPTNYNRYGAATMFTLFFGGDVFAPGIEVDGLPVQGWLQEHYIAAMKHAARRLKSCAAIVGWGSMNEPHQGYMGYKDLSSLENCVVRMGAMPSGFQSMAAASGWPTKVDRYSVLGPREPAGETLNPEGISLFVDGATCPWKRLGVWTDDGGAPKLLRPDYFSSVGGKPLRFSDDFLKPFAKRFSAALREKDERRIVFIEGVPNVESPTWSAEDGAGFVHAFHWYDGATLITKHFSPHVSVRVDTRRPVLGRGRVAASFAEQMAAHLRWTKERMGGMPCLIAEFGLPFDLNGRSAQKAFASGDYHLHEEALSMYYDGIDANLLHSTIWNYAASNSNEGGDGWNDENLSIYSKDAVAPALAAGVAVEDAGGRGLDGFRRPYPMATAGTPLFLRWSRAEGVLEYHFRSQEGLGVPTVLYAPPECFGGAISCSVMSDEGEGGLSAAVDEGGRRVLVTVSGASRTVRVRLEPASGAA